MATIPQYTPRVGTPSNLISGGQLINRRSVDIDLSGIASFAERLQKRKEQNEINNMRAELSAEEPKAQLEFAMAFDQIQRDWTPGSRPVADQMTEVIDKYQGDAQKRFTNPRAQEFLTEQTNAYKTDYALRGFAFQQKVEIDNRTKTYETTYGNIGNLGAIDPSTFGRELVKANAAVMADSQIPERDKLGFIETQSKKAAVQVAKARAELNPGETLPIVNKLLGVTESSLSLARGSDIKAEILRLESGGRMYDEAGKLLRGPEIKGKVGKPYYAYGKFQILDSTAQDVAAGMGIPWRPDVFYRDRTGNARLDEETERYHELLGENYIAQQSEAFNNDPVLIAAAYNMGPQAARGWAEGRPYQTQSGRWWYPRGRKDLAALPDETRKYLSSLGTLKEEPVSSNIDITTEQATAFRLLDVDDLLDIKNSAESVLAAQDRARQQTMQSEKVLFKQFITDIEVAGKNGDVVNMPSDAALVTYLGPSVAALTKQRLLGYQQMAGALKRLPAMTNAELNSYANMQDPEGAEDRENRQFIKDTVSKQAGLILAARKTDPGQAALDNNQLVGDAYTAWSKSANEFYGARKNSTQEQFDAMAKAQSGFVRANFAQQRQWGISQPTLPKQIVDKMAEGFRVLIEDNPEQAAAYIASQPDLMGSESAVGQLGDKIGSLAWLAMDGVPGLTLSKLKAARSIPAAKRYELLPTGISRNDVDTAVRSAFDPLLTSLAFQNDSVTAERYLDAGVTLTLEKLNTFGGSVRAAATAAYADLFADRNVVNGTYRVDTAQHDADAIAERLEYAKATIPSGQLLVAPEPGFTLAESAERKARSMRNTAYWVNNKSGDGVYLMHSTGPVLDVNGMPIEMLFDEVMNLSPPPPVITFRGGGGL